MAGCKGVHLYLKNTDDVNCELIPYVQALRVPASISKKDYHSILDKNKQNIPVLLIEENKKFLNQHMKDVFYLNPEAALSNFNSKSNSIIGGLAKTYADAKNWERWNVDFIDFNPQPKTIENSILGSEGWNFIPSKNELYGWMITSLTVPVFFHCPRALSEIQEVVQEVDLKGVYIGENYNWSSNRLTELKTITDWLG